MERGAKVHGLLQPLTGPNLKDIVTLYATSQHHSLKFGHHDGWEVGTNLNGFQPHVPLLQSFQSPSTSKSWGQVKRLDPSSAQMVGGLDSDV